MWIFFAFFLDIAAKNGYNSSGGKKMKEEEKIRAGILFCPGDPELKAIKLKTHNLNVDYNNTHEDETEKRAEILSEIIGEFGAAKVLMKPAAPGTGVIAGGPVRAVVESAGIKDIRTKALRSNNPCNVVRAVIEGLKSLRSAQEVAEIRGKTVEEILR